MLAFRRRMRDPGAGAVQQFGEDILPLVLLAAISVTGLVLTVSYTWLRGYAYEFLAILHAVTVIVTLLWLRSGISSISSSDRPSSGRLLQGRRPGIRAGALRSLRRDFASAAMIRDLITVERELGFRYETTAPGATHYQQICPACRRALFGLAQGALWSKQDT